MPRLHPEHARSRDLGVAAMTIPAPDSMIAARPVHPWVAEHRVEIRFALQAIARPDDPEPGAVEIAAGQLAKELGFDAFFLGDHRFTRTASVRQ